MIIAKHNRQFIAILLFSLLVFLRPQTDVTLQAKSGIFGSKIVNQPLESLSSGETTATFIENVGQFPTAARFYAPLASGVSLWVTDTELWLSWQNSVQATGEVQQAQVKLSFPNANPRAQLEAFIPQESRVSFLQGPRSGWQTNVPLWQGVRYRHFYPGFDLEIESQARQLKWRLVAQQSVPQASAFQRFPDVHLRIDGANDLMLGDGHLALNTPLGHYRLPLLDLAGTKVRDKAIASPAVVDGQTVISPLNLTSPQASQPALPGARPRAQTSAYIAYSAFLGGSGDECIFNCVVALDAGGSAYIAGYTRSLDFPTTPGVVNRTPQGNNDIFVIKVNLDGDELDYATLIGGSQADFGTALAIDPQGYAYLTGYTASEDFPITNSAYQATFGGGFADAFVLKLNPDGSDLAYATFIGGEGNDRGAAIAVDRRGNAYLAGETQSEEFPVSTNAFAPEYARRGDGFVVKLNTRGSRLAYSTFLGGTGRDDARAIAVDAVGNAYITGRTTSADFPVTADAWATARSGSADAYVAKLNSDGTNLIYATFLGGSSNDQSNGLAIDNRGNAYIVGSTLSGDFPTTETAFDQTHDGGYDAFVAKLTRDGTRLAYATLLGGSAGDRGYAVTVDNQGGAYVTGYTYSTDFPTTGRAVDVIHDGDFADAFVAKLDADGIGLAYATFLGGNQSDYGTAIAVDGQGSAYVVGATQSAEFPVSRLTVGARYQGAWDGFVTKLAVGGDQATAIIGGIVRDQAGYGVPGVVISAGASGSTTTDENGSFAFIGLKEGIYTLSPLKEDYTFSPPRRTVTVPSSEGIQVFNALVGGNPPEPFLDLPFDYEDSTAIFLQALRDVEDGGWVTSWFDHAYPDYAKNRNLLLWDGQTHTKSLFNASLGCYEGRCYDGHNGVDITNRVFGTRNPNAKGVEIRAAADGVVVAQRNDCRMGLIRCGGGYGNQIILRHDNGYFTFYGHLSRVTLTQSVVKAGDPIGIMGSTGHSTGPHLHFGVYQDNGNDVWDGDKVDLPLDPFGWRGEEGDPWVLDHQGPVSHYLWRYPLSVVESFAGQQGVVLGDTSGELQVTVPPDAFSGEVTLEFLLAPVATNPSGTRRVGQSFWLRLLEWLPTSSTQARQDAVTTVTDALNQSLTQPITLTATYTDAQVRHLNVDKMTFARWDNASRSWQTLQTQVEPISRTVTAQTSALGDFALQAPLHCSDDFVEPDDAYFVARAIEPDAAPISRLFDIPGDEDWFYLEAEGGRTYIIQTQNLARGVDTMMELYSVDSQTLLADNDNSYGNYASTIEWQPRLDSVYFIRVLQAENSRHGCQASYELQVTLKPFEVFLPLIVR